MQEQQQKKKNRILCSWKIWTSQFVSFDRGVWGFFLLQCVFCLCLGQITKHDFNIFFSTQRTTLSKQLISIPKQLFTGETISYWTWQAHYLQCRRNWIPNWIYLKASGGGACMWVCVGVCLVELFVQGGGIRQLRYEVQRVWVKVIAGWLRWSHRISARPSRQRHPWQDAWFSICIFPCIQHTECFE